MFTRIGSVSLQTFIIGIQITFWFNFFTSISSSSFRFARLNMYKEKGTQNTRWSLLSSPERCICNHELSIGVLCFKGKEKTSSSELFCDVSFILKYEYGFMENHFKQQTLYSITYFNGSHQKDRILPLI